MLNITNFVTNTTHVSVKVQGYAARNCSHAAPLRCTEKGSAWKRAMQWERALQVGMIGRLCDRPTSDRERFHLSRVVLSFLNRQAATP